MSDTSGTTTSGVEDFDPKLFGVGGNFPDPDDEAKWESVISQVSGEGNEGDKDETQETQGTQEQDEETEPEDETATNSPGGETGEEGGEGENVGATGEELDLAAFFTEKYGKPPTREELEGLVNLNAWFANLNEQQIEAINNTLFAPQGQQQQYQQQTPPSPPEPSPTQALAEKYADDPDLGPLYAQMAAQEAEIENLKNQTTQTYAQQQMEQTQRELLTAKTSFIEAYNLTEQDYQVLEGAVANSRILPGLAASLGDNTQAMYQALEHVYWTSPTFRNAAIERTVQEKATKEQQQHAPRKTRATSVTGTGGNGASRTQPPPKTPEDRWAAVAAGFREASNGGLPE